MGDSLLTNVRVVPMDGDVSPDVSSPDASPLHPSPLGQVRKQSIRIRDGRIAALGQLEPQPGERVFDGAAHVAIPGFVQGHLHYCQTLFRGLADDLPLMAWLSDRIWPLEAAHDAASTRASARLSIAELLLGGTTTTQVMESVRHAEFAATAALESGMTTILGNCLMDVGGPDTPKNLPCSTSEAMAMVRQLHEEIDRQAAGGRRRLHYAVSPRFILSCSAALSAAAADYARSHGLRIHTHAAEHPEEVALVRKQTGRDYILALQDQGLLGPRTSLAHCVHTTVPERDALVATGTAVLHCPSTNLKLGSGIAPITDYDSRGLRIALGADGAACNNRLSALTELRQAALLQAASAGPGAWPAARALRAATIGGAAALGLDDELGSITVGKRADLVLMDLDTLPLAPAGDLASRLVFAAETANVRHVMLGGEWVVRDGQLTEMDAIEITRDATRQRDAVLARAGLAR